MKDVESLVDGFAYKGIPDSVLWELDRGWLFGQIRQTEENLWQKNSGI